VSTTRWPRFAKGKRSAMLWYASGDLHRVYAGFDWRQPKPRTYSFPAITDDSSRLRRVFPKKNPTAQARDLSRDTTKIAVPHRQRENPSNEVAWLLGGMDANVLGIRERNGVLSYLLHRAVYRGRGRIFWHCDGPTWTAESSQLIELYRT